MTTTQVQINEKVLSVINLLNNAMAKSPTGVSFLSIKNYESSSKDAKVIVAKIANYTINIGASYAKLQARELKRLENLDVTDAKHNFKSDVVTLETARVALINSIVAPSENRSNGQINAYTVINGALKVHNETGLLYIFGYKLRETVIRKGEKNPTKSAALTIAKNEIKKRGLTSKYTQFSLAIGNEIKTNGTTIEL